MYYYGLIGVTAKLAGLKGPENANFSTNCVLCYVVHSTLLSLPYLAYVLV